MNGHELQFVEAFRYMQTLAAAINKKNNFTAEDDLIGEFEAELAAKAALQKYAPLVAAFRNARVGLKLALAMGELGETLEAVRKNRGADEHCPEFTAETVEIADAILRLMNYATNRNLPLAEALVAKNAFNRDRADHQADARAGEHGKQF